MVRRKYVTALFRYSPISDKDVKNEMKVKDFLLNISLEDRKLIGEIKSSFPCWRKDNEKKEKPKTIQKILRIVKICGYILAFCMVTFAFGFLLRNSEYLSTFIVKNV